MPYNKSVYDGRNWWLLQLKHFDKHITCREMANLARGCPAWYPLAVLSLHRWQEGRHCQVCLLDDRRPGAAGSGECCHHGDSASGFPLCEPGGGGGACWLIYASEPVTQDCLQELQSQYLPVFKSNYSLVTGFRDVWIPVSALTLSSCLTPGKWLDLFELPLVGQSLTIMLPRKGF